MNHNKRIGILGGGQLGKMLLEAGSPLSLDISILDNSVDFPAGKLTSKFTEGDFKDYDTVVKFGKDKDIVTVEIESVNVEALETLEQHGVDVYPSPKSLKKIRDKGIQKQFYADHNIPTSKFSLFTDKDQILSALSTGEVTIPFVQKARRDGYDGQGVHVVRTEQDLANLFNVPSLVEDLVSIEKELAVIVARSNSGETKTFPLVEMEFHPTANLVEFLFSPSQVPNSVHREAQAIATKVTESLDIVGLLAVEMFYTKDGKLLVNEVAPRPHNSGHHTIEGCVTSQYQQHLRAILGFPLGDTTLTKPSTMINLLGEEGHIGTAVYEGLEEILTYSGVYPHIYGKSLTKPFRKMGHITVTHDDLEGAKRVAREIKSIIKVKSSNE